MTNFISLTTPLNLLEERDKFFASKTYNPIFHYLWQDESETDDTYSDPLRRQLWEAIIAQDHTRITSSGAELFEMELSDKLHELAIFTIKNQSKNISTGSAQQYTTLLEIALKEFSLDYQVIITPQPGFYVRPNHKEKSILVSSGIHFEFFSMEGEVRHELSHVLRYKNGEYNHIKRSTRYLPTEEGLAAFVQDYNFGDKDRSSVQHAIEYLGSEIGANGSLRDVFNFMVESDMSEDLAWKRASRHKFGFVDTSRPGDIMKPAMYFANEIKVAQLTTDEKVRLYVGKISLQALHLYPTYQGLWPAEKLINYFNL